MAASATMQAILAKPTIRISNGTKTNGGLLRMQRNSNMKVRCMAEPEGKKEEALPAATPTPLQSTTSPPPPTPSPMLKEPSATSFFDVFSFSGPGPERINGRLAMIGFVGALAAEFSTGEDVLTQIGNGGVPWVLGTSVLFSLASVIPLFKGVGESKYTKGVMNSNAEMVNGRIAMLGLLGLVFTEFVKGGALG